MWVLLLQVGDWYPSDNWNKLWWVLFYRLIARQSIERIHMCLMLYLQAMRLCLTRVQGPTRVFIVSCWYCSDSSVGKQCMNQDGANSSTLVSLLPYTISAFPWLRFSTIVRGRVAAEDEEVRWASSSFNNLILHTHNEIYASIVL